jgi:phospho-N-acetylmuramoyl-pentapeptide-transferase
MALTMALATIAIMTDTLGEGIGIAVLPIIALPLVGTVATNVLQVLSKKFLGRKIFKVAPIHHHFEAIGWPSYKVTMRYWIITLIFAVIGIAIAVVG